MSTQRDTMKKKSSVFFMIFCPFVVFFIYIGLILLINMISVPRDNTYIPIGRILHFVFFLFLGVLSIIPALLLCYQSRKRITINIPLLISGIMVILLFLIRYFTDFQIKLAGRFVFSPSLLFLGGNMITMASIPINQRTNKWRVYLAAWTSILLLLALEMVQRQFVLIGIHSSYQMLLLKFLGYAPYITFLLIGIIAMIMVTGYVAPFPFHPGLVIVTCLFVFYCVYMLFISPYLIPKGIILGYVSALNIRFPGIGCAIFCFAGEFGTIVYSQIKRTRQLVE